MGNKEKSIRDNKNSSQIDGKRKSSNESKNGNFENRKHNNDPVIARPAPSRPPRKK